MSFLSSSCATAVACAFLAGPVFAGDPSPVGQWEVSTGESRYRISYCGKSGQELCAKLTWLRKDARTKANLALLNKTVVKNAKRADENRWIGTVVYDGQSYESTVTLVSNNSLQLNSCSGIFCQSFHLNRL
jgi:uncharacterized protein (DUF2147 family)